MQFKDCLWEDENKSSIFYQNQVAGMVQKPKKARAGWKDTTTDYHAEGTSKLAANRLVNIIKAFPSLPEDMVWQIFS